MKVYYLFDGNVVKDFIIAKEGRESYCMSVFEECSKRGEYTSYSWLSDRLVIVDLEGEVREKANDLYTIYINNKPSRAIVNPTVNEKAKLFDYCYENSSDYRKCRIGKEVVWVDF